MGKIENYMGIDTIFFDMCITDLPLSPNRLKSIDKQLTSEHLPRYSIRDIKGVLLDKKVFDPTTQRIVSLGVEALYKQLLRQSDAHFFDKDFASLFAADHEEKILLVKSQLSEIKEFLVHKMDPRIGEGMIFLPTETCWTRKGDIWPNEKDLNTHMENILVYYSTLKALEERNYEEAYQGILLHPGKSK